MLWLKHDLEGRSKHLPDLLTAIRIFLLSPEFLKNNEENLIKENLKCKTNYYCFIKYFFIKKIYILFTGVTYLCENYQALFLNNTKSWETSMLSKNTHRKYNQLKQIKWFDEVKSEDFM